MKLKKLISEELGRTVVTRAGVEGKGRVHSRYQNTVREENCSPQSATIYDSFPIKNN
jgi:hypothetical protein